LPLLVIPAAEIGRRAARQLLRRLEQAGEGPERDVLPMDLLLPSQPG
jgi:DNA-binding LacI/PurR family transcriptional regulator